MNDYVMVETSTGAYAVSPALVRRVAYQSAYYRAKDGSKTRKTVDEGFLLPTTYHYEFDFKGATRKGHQAEDDMASHLDRLLVEGERNQEVGRSTGLGGKLEELRQELVWREKVGRLAKESTTAALKAASRQSMQNIDRTVGRWETATAVATFTRDLSADVFIVCAGTLSGGAALAGLGAGSFAKGAFKYQDTENVGAAILEGTFSFVTGVIPVPGAAKVGRGQHYAIVASKTKLEATGKFAVALVEGKDPAEAALSAGVSTVVGLGAGKLAKKLAPDDLGAIKRLMGDTAIPVSVRLRLDVAPGPVARTIAAEGLKVGAGKGAGAVTQALTARRRASAGRRPRLPLGDPIMADIAIMGPDSCQPPRRWL
ncbi:MAG: hypothetical protein RLN75_03505 [Longimicrobiales bacterium]